MDRDSSHKGLTFGKVMELMGSGILLKALMQGLESALAYPIVLDTLLNLLTFVFCQGCPRTPSFLIQRRYF
jgi:hypothetical protein